MDWTSRRERFRVILSGARCVYPASVFDPISARIAEDLGFEAGMLAGSVASMTVLGAPDLIVLTLTDLAAQAYRICRAGTLPLLVDADHGYGNALNVMRTVEELETAGVAGLTIEDTDLPQPYGAAGATRLLPLEEGIGKMKAALAARSDPRLVIAGRTGAMATAGTEDALRRIAAYAAVGVDAVFLSGVKTRDQVEAAAASVDVPILLGAPAPEVMDLDFLSEAGVRVCLQGHHPFMAAVEAVHAMLKALRDGTPPSGLSGIAPGARMKEATRDAAYRRWMEDFLGG